MNLFLGLLALALGPLLYFACQRLTISRSALDGLLFITIAGIVRCAHRSRRAGR